MPRAAPRFVIFLRACTTITMSDALAVTQSSGHLLMVSALVFYAQVQIHQSWRLQACWHLETSGMLVPRNHRHAGTVQTM